VIQIRAGNCSLDQLVTLIRENARQIALHAQFVGPLLEIGRTIQSATLSQPPSIDPL
jgi:hypothetical protein